MDISILAKRNNNSNTNSNNNQAETTLCPWVKFRLQQALDVYVVQHNYALLFWVQSHKPTTIEPIYASHAALRGGRIENNGR
jgi:hypothetical protein